MKKLELVKILILQSSKVVTILYAILGLVYVPIGLVMPFSDSPR